ncbi:hypothetical protein D3C79_952020 [compost metagenome]
MKIGQPLVDPGHRRDRTFRRRPAHDHRKFIPAKTPHHIAGAQRELQLTGDGDDRLIANVMAPGIVNALKVIDIDQQNGGTAVVAAAVFKFGAQQ